MAINSAAKVKPGALRLRRNDKRRLNKASGAIVYPRILRNAQSRIENEKGLRFAGVVEEKALDSIRNEHDVAKVRRNAGNIGTALQALSNEACVLNRNRAALWGEAISFGGGSREAHQRADQSYGDCNAKQQRSQEGDSTRKNARAPVKNCKATAIERRYESGEQK